ncbi:GNAT family N-acetyltransferase [Janibacter alittae]|uniref:GNAT family N-acetyltransferase n=1 Tax=Janibacter alittae TaxID=3115209 RepID=A0ABZ2MEV3_9MICO
MAPRTPWVVPADLHGEGVRLRPLRDDDLAIAEPHDHPAHHLPAHAVPTPETFDEWVLRRRESVALGMSMVWCITDPADDEPLGEVLVFVRSGHLAEGGTAELGYTVRPSARGRGLAREAARSAAAHALQPTARGGLGLRRLVAETAADHAASNRVLTAAGFTVWGRERAADAPDGSVGPALHWERLAEG